MAEDEFELVPITPVRRLEREIRLLKEQVKGPESPQLVSQVIEILKTNQQIIDQITMKQSELIAKLSETNSRLQSLTESIGKLLEAASGDEEEEAEPEDHGGKLEKIIEQNAALINSISVLAREMSKLGEAK